MHIEIFVFILLRDVLRVNESFLDHSLVLSDLGLLSLPLLLNHLLLMESVHFVLLPLLLGLSFGGLFFLLRKDVLHNSFVCREDVVLTGTVVNILINFYRFVRHSFLVVLPIFLIRDLCLGLSWLHKLLGLKWGSIKTFSLAIGNYLISDIRNSDGWFRFLVSWLPWSNITLR